MPIAIYDKPKVSERILIYLHPLFAWLGRHLPQTFGPPAEKPPHPSAMLSNHNRLWRLIFPRFFRRITVDEAAIGDLKVAAESSTLVYVSKQMGQLEYHYFNHLFLERGLPLAEYTNALTLRRWKPWHDYWQSIKAEEYEIGRRGRPCDPLQDGDLPEMVSAGACVLLVIPPSSLADEGLFLIGPIRALSSLIEAQRNTPRPISLVPLDFIWSRRPESPTRSVIDILFGEKESPGAIRKVILFWRNYKRRAQAAIGKPIDLKTFLEKYQGEGDTQIASRLREVLIDVLRSQRRTITGPPVRPKAWFVQEVTGDEALDRHICDIAAEKGRPADELRELAQRYAQEIVADIDHTYIELLDRLLTPAFNRLYEAVHVDSEGLRKIKELYSRGPIVLVPNHKSHVDYLILSHVLYHNGMTVPHIAAGINLEFWPLGAFFRRCGAYFIRRAFRGNALYTEVLVTYLKVLLKGGYCQEFFIEGGRSRTGKLARPKKGMLKMLLQAARDAGIDEMHLIPVAITYDRVIEQKSYTRELEGATKETERPRHLIGLTKYLRHRRHRYGSIYVQFGEPLRVRGNTCDPGAADELANNICQQINRRVIVTPAAVAAAALLTSTKRGITLDEVRRNWDEILACLKTNGADLSAHFLAPQEKTMEDALSLLIQAKLVSKRTDAIEPFLSIDEEKRLPLVYYRNSIVHFLATTGVVSQILLTHYPSGHAVQSDEIAANVGTFNQLLAHEFCIATHQATRELVDISTQFLLNRGAIVRNNDQTFEITPDGVWICKLFARQIRPFFETLLIAFRHISEKMSGPMEERTILSELMRTGRDFYLLGRIRHWEAITKAGFENALRTLCSFKVIEIRESAGTTKGRKIYAPTNDLDANQIFKAELERVL